MKQTLSLKLGQQLTMTPQLQQAIRLLQLSTMDLQQEIQQTLESNPMLEYEELESDNADELGADEFDLEGDADGEAAGEADSADADETDDDFDDDSDGIDDDGGPLDASDLQQDDGDPDTEAMTDGDSIPEDLPVDTSWEDVYQPSSSGSSGSGDDAEWSMEERNGTSESLQDHLLWQLNLTPFSEVDRLIATAIIDSVDADGMLTSSIDDIVESLNSDTDPDDPEAVRVEVDEVQAVLTRIQHFDPTGVAARNLAECLHLQLMALAADTPWRDEAAALVSEHLDLLAARDFATLKRKTRLDEERLGSVVALIQSMNPRPGSSITSEEAEYVVPDVIVHKERGRWVVELNQEATPRIRINDTYAALVKRADSSADNTYLKDNLQEARWFLKSLQSRNETLLKVATRIVEHQRGFLEYGEEAMKPLVLHDIAEAVEMHESTISRVTSRKYMHTPRGIFELKYFFSSHVSTNTGGEVSSTAIRALIKKLTADENPKKPLSDNKIAAILAEQNIRVARRTVAKYRESMAIPPSNERKRLV